MTTVALGVAVVIVLLARVVIQMLGYDSLNVPSEARAVVDVAAVGLLVMFGWAVLGEFRGR